MRSLDRYRQRHKKNPQSSQEKQDSTVDWDFKTNDYTPPPKFNITLDQTDNETKPERFERYIRQLGRSVLACSLCERGCRMFKLGNNSRIPHFQPSIWHKKIMFIKYEPNGNDIYGLFYNTKEILNKYGAKLDNFYRTSVIKCAGDQPNECPYFQLEWQALQQCLPSLIICFDRLSAEAIREEYIPKKIQKLAYYKLFCVGDDNDGLELIIKALSTPQTRNHLIS